MSREAGLRCARVTEQFAALYDGTCLMTEMNELAHQAALRPDNSSNALARLARTSSSHYLSSSSSTISMQRLGLDSAVLQGGSSSDIARLHASSGSITAAEVPSASPTPACRPPAGPETSLAASPAAAPAVSAAVQPDDTAHMVRIDEPADGHHNPKAEFVRQWVQTQQLTAGLPRQAHPGGRSCGCRPAGGAPPNRALPLLLADERQLEQLPPLPVDIQDDLHRYWQQQQQQQQERERALALGSHAALLAAGAAAACQSLARRWSGVAAVLAGSCLLAAGHLLVMLAPGTAGHCTPSEGDGAACCQGDAAGDAGSAVCSASDAPGPYVGSRSAGAAMAADTAAALAFVLAAAGGRTPPRRQSLLLLP